jgi:hypothetical protein
LPSYQQLALILPHYEGFSYSEAAAQCFGQGVRVIVAARETHAATGIDGVRKKYFD